MKDLALITLKIAKHIQEEVNEVSKPPIAAERPKTQYVVDFALIKGTRGYLEKVTHQINGAYEHGWYDACAVMLRRLIETLIIECFEHHKIASHIKDTNDEFVSLKDLIDITIKEQSWNLGRDTKKALPKLKTIGDKAAHNRRYNGYRSDIENLLSEIRLVIQELTSLANLK